MKRYGNKVRVTPHHGMGRRRECTQRYWLWQNRPRSQRRRNAPRLAYKKKRFNNIRSLAEMSKLLRTDHFYDQRENGKICIKQKLLKFVGG